MLKRYFGSKKDPFEKYVICPKCGSLYQFKECFDVTVSGNTIPKSCNHVAFRNHPFVSHRKPCGHQLVKEVVTKSGKNIIL